MHTIYVRDLHVSATHGYYSFEKVKAQTFIVSISAMVDDWSSQDDLKETLNYELLRDLAIETLSQSPKNLLETLANSLVEKTLLLPKVFQATVSLEKSDIFPDCIAGVSLTKRK